MFGILARVATRQNPEIDIGAVDMSCAFILCDITIYDDPIVYVSEAFERLTGYTKHEILGRNCRFLQSPDGNVDAGVKRKWVDNQTVFRLKSKLQARSEVQVSLINYRKGGQSFMNLLTMIPVRWESEEYKFSVGFQVDLVEKPQAVTKRNADGSYAINYQRDHLPRYVLHAPDQPRGLPKLISHDAVSAVLTAIGSGGTQISRSYLDKVLLENTDDVIHVLSLKGLFLYLSPSGHRLLEYDANELVGNALSSVCHPSDIVPVIRELKQSIPGTSISVAYRIRRKYSGYMWFECLGSLHIDPGKGRKCLILVGRERPVYALGKTAILETGGIGENDLWSKMSISGMFLFVSSNVRALLDRQPGELFGKNIHEFMRDESRGELGKALDVTRTGRQATFKHELRHKRGHVLQAQTRLYPGDSKPGSKPSFLVAQTRLLKSSRSNFLPSSTPTVLSSEGDLSAGFATPATSGSGGSSSTMEQQRDVSSTLSSQSLESSTETGLPLGNQENTLLSEDNIFEELEGTRSSNWQFELRQLERSNRLLAEELQGLLSRRKKRKRKKGPFEKACVTCNSRNTPEWRRGPSGNRDLCNSCGLRWAKQTGRISPRKNSDYSDKNSTPSPAKTTDDKPQESNKATLHIGDNVSYSNRLAE
jgi:PAS domain S-box-containing protein